MLEYYTKTETVRTLNNPALPPCSFPLPPGRWKSAFTCPRVAASVAIQNNTVHAQEPKHQWRTGERASEKESYGVRVSARETDRRVPRLCISLVLTQTP